MKTKSISIPKDIFEKNFLFEAPDKEPERKRNVKVISVPSADGRRTDYTKSRGSKQEQQQTDELSDEDFDNIFVYNCFRYIFIYNLFFY